MKLHHTYVPGVHLFDFTTINTLDDYIETVVATAADKQNELPSNTPDRDTALKQIYADHTGMAFEVYTEFFFKHFGQLDTVDVATIDDTSFNKYQDGLDFWTTTKKGEVGIIQSKFRSQHVQLAASDLEAFRDRIDDSDISPKNAIIFTSRIVTDNDPLFKFNPARETWARSIAKKCSVFDAVKQHNIIQLHDAVNPVPFFELFALAVTESATMQRTRVQMPPHYDHQKKMKKAGAALIGSNNPRGTIICATGGGKTNVEWDLIRDLHMKALKSDQQSITVLVAPSLALCGQHFDVFAGLDAGDNKSLFDHGVHAINFHTGGMNSYDGPKESLTRGTNVTITTDALKSNKNIHITVTYKSLHTLVTLLVDMGIEADLTICDEFHILVPNLPEKDVTLYREHLLTFPSKKMLFFSACNKRSSYLSTDDTEVFGEELVNIGVQELIDVGVLKRNYKVIIVRTSAITSSQISKATGLRKSIAQTAKVAKGDIDEYALYKESAFVLKAMEDAGSEAVGIAFAKKVDRMHAMVDDQAFNDQLNRQAPTVVKYIDANVHTRIRMSVFEAIRNTERGLLVQHSTVREGVDVPNLNCSLVMREMSPIAFQQGPFGRICRTTAADRKRLTDGDITPEELNDTGTIYLLVDDTDEERFADYVTKYIRNIVYTGLERDQWEMAEVGHKRYGVTPGDKTVDTSAQQMSDDAMDKLKDKVYLDHIDIERELQMVNELTSVTSTAPTF